MHWRVVSLSLVLCGSVACTRLPPTVPHLLVAPAPGKALATFAAEDAKCRDWAATRGAPGPVSPGTAIRLVTLALGAGLGLLLGAATGALGPGLAIGTGLGVWVGDRLGAEQEERSRVALQRNYDIAYAQCMATEGNQLPFTLWWYQEGPRK